MTIKLYGLAKCSTCKKAMAWLDSHDLEYQFVDYRENPINAEELKSWAQQLGWPKVVNRASMTWRQLSDSQKDPQDDTQWLGLIKEYPALVRRPVAVFNDEAGFGFNEKTYTQRFLS